MIKLGDRYLFNSSSRLIFVCEIIKLEPKLTYEIKQIIQNPNTHNTYLGEIVETFSNSTDSLSSHFTFLPNQEALT